MAANGGPEKKMKTEATDLTGTPVVQPIVRINTRQYGVTEDDLQTFFAECKIERMFVPKSGQFAFVEFTDLENAEKAKEKNGEKLGRCKTKIFSQSSLQWTKAETVDAIENTVAQTPASAESHLVVLKYLPYEATVEEVTAIFDEQEVLHVHLVHETFRKRGSLAIIEFEKEEDQKAALEKNKTKGPNGRHLNISALEQEALVRVLDVLNAEVDPDYILVKVTGISYDAKEADIDELFEGVEAEERFLVKTLENENIGILFAAFSSKEDAAELLLRNNEWVSGRPVQMVRGHAEGLTCLTAAAIVQGRSIFQQRRYDNRQNNSRFNIKRKFRGGGRGRRFNNRRQERQAPTKESLDAEMDSYKKSGTGGAEGSTS